MGPERLGQKPGLRFEAEEVVVEGTNDADNGKRLFSESIQSRVSCSQRLQSGSELTSSCISHDSHPHRLCFSLGLRCIQYRTSCRQ